jgi:hypothetical protein
MKSSILSTIIITILWDRSAIPVISSANANPVNDFVQANFSGFCIKLGQLSQGTIQFG